MKHLDDHFADWESHVFGFGYGTGEEHVIQSLKLFLENTPEKDCYDHEAISALLTPTVTWLLINTLCKADILEYGTSPRFAWLTNEGKALKQYTNTKTLEELLEICNKDENYHGCAPDYCNCDDERCANPFWKQKARL